jgi:hypothetical protein
MFVQDQVGNVVLNGDGAAPQAAFDIRQTTSSTVPTIIANQPTSSTGDFMQFRKNNVNVLTISNTGNIMTPGSITASNLRVLGDYVILDTITSNTEQMVITNDGTGPALKVTQTGANSIAEFYDDGNALAVKIANNGLVGIGTNNPQAKLHIVGSVKATSSISSDTQFLGQASDSATAPSFSFAANANTGVFQPAPSNLAVTTGGTERMRVLANGNVGIGTTNPQNTLQVWGTTRLGGATNDSVQTTNYGRFQNIMDEISPDQSLTHYYSRIMTTAITPTADRYWYNVDNQFFNNSIGSTTVGQRQFIYGTRNYCRNARTDGGTGHILNWVGTQNQLENYAGSTAPNSIEDAYGTYNSILQYRAGSLANAYGTYNNMSRVAGTLTNSYGVYVNTSGTIGNSYGVYTTGEQKNYFSGNVGIGTTNPSIALHVMGDIGFSYAGSIRVSPQNSTGWTTGTTKLIEASYNINNLQGDVVSIYTPGSGSALPRISATSTGVIHLNGNVGIGATSPGAQLEVRGFGQLGDTTFNTSGSVGGTLCLRDWGDQAFNGGAIIFGFQQGNYAAIKGLATNGAGNTQGRIAFFTRNAAADSTLTLRAMISETGNVSIGNQYPVNKLHVVGDSTGGNAILVDNHPASDAASKTLLTGRNYASLSRGMSGAGLYWYGTSGTTTYRYSLSITTYFTGQHAGLPSDPDVKANIQNYVGLIASAADTGYMTYNSVTDTEITGSNAIQINEALPNITISCIDNDPAVFGVISDRKDNASTNTDGTTETDSDPMFGNDLRGRVRVNSIGEGAIWVTNINGNIRNGDYITSSTVPGYGKKQDDDILHNYTVAKATMSCTFDLNTGKYKCEEFYVENVGTLRKAFIGCTYHCG